MRTMLVVKNALRRAQAPFENLSQLFHRRDVLSWRENPTRERYTMDILTRRKQMQKCSRGERLPVGGKNWYCKFARGSRLFARRRPSDVAGNRVGSWHYILSCVCWSMKSAGAAIGVAAFNRKISMSCRESRQQSGWRHSAWENFLREWMKYQFLLRRLGRVSGRWQFRRASMDTWPPPDGSQLSVAPFMPFCWHVVPAKRERAARIAQRLFS